MKKEAFGFWTFGLCSERSPSREHEPDRRGLTCPSMIS